MFQKTYIFNKKIVFWPERQLLSDDLDENKSVQLTGPASRCLELMLSRRELITQSEFYEYVWQDNGFTPTPNTLYQSISVLRRALKELDDSNQNFILTEPRKGFRINPLVSVDSLQREYPVTINEEELSTEQVKKGQPPNRDILKQKITLKMPLSFILLLIIFSAFVYSYFLHSSQDNKSSILSTYKKSVKENGCIFLLPQELSSTIVEKIDILRLSCEKRPVNYVTAYDYSSHISILSCNKEIEKSPEDCGVLYLRSGNENK